MTILFILPCYLWNIVLLEQGQEQKIQELDFRVLLCDIQIQSSYIRGNFYNNIFYFSFLWRVFLILYADGFIRNGKLNLRLFVQLFWLITLAFVAIAYNVFPGSMLLRGEFHPQESVGSAFRPLICYKHICSDFH